MASNVTTFIIKRILRAVLMLWAVISVLFILFRVIPGDPTGMFARGGLAQETRQQLLREWGLTQPLHEQYFLYIKNLLLNGELGVSFYYREPVMGILVSRLAHTLLLMIPAFVTMTILAYFTGTYLGWKKGERIERTGSTVFVTLRSLPHFVLGLFLLIIFSYHLDVFPIQGAAPLALKGTTTAFQKITKPWFYLHLFLPFLTVFFHWFADPFLLIRGNIINQTHQDYVRLLRLKGLPESQVREHAAKNSRLPMITYMSTLVNIAFSGVVLVEVVFSWPGIGRELVLATFRQDFPVAQGAFFIIAGAIITANLVIDLLYGYLDPRIEYGKS